AIPLGQYIRRFVDNKQLVDNLVGAENNRGVSGGTGPGDWVTAASRAGFDYIDGVVGFAYLSMPLTARPDGWTDEYIRSTGYHDPIPPSVDDRIYFFELADAKDFVADDDGILTVSGGELGEFSSLAEGRSNCAPDCTFDEADVTAAVDAIKHAIETRDTTRVAKINMHIPLALLTDENEMLLRSYLSQVKTLVDSGDVTWATQLGAYEFYEDWENIQH
ncbi:MAG: hypothetical protein NUV56_04555, partial [Candidatus Uhrbacteria bacterium]|nr:hypothetical protein [Candidatus Uhrbacteria bacterium]